jgi:hypothetical protein
MGFRSVTVRDGGSSFRELVVHGVRVAALPADMRLGLAALRSAPRPTRKQRWALRMTRLLVQARLWPFITRTLSEQDSQTLRAVTTAVREWRPESPPSPAALMWPVQVGRARAYVHLLDMVSGQRWFAKVGIDSENSDQLKAEAASTTWVNELLGESRVTVPVARHTSDAVDAFVAVYDAIPPGARSIAAGHDYPDELIASLRSRQQHLPVAAVLENGFLSAWRNEGATLHPRFDRELWRELSTASTVPMGPIHGDLSRSNVFRAQGSLVVVDWECAAMDGPILLDEMSFRLAVARRRRYGRQRRVRRLLNEMVTNYSKLDVMLALVYRRHVGHAIEVDRTIKDWLPAYG